MTNEKLTIKQNVLYVSGSLQLKEAMPVLTAAKQIIADNPITKVDFSHSTDSDTTGVLLMLTLQRYTHQKIVFVKIPRRLRALLNLSNLTDTFAIE